MWRTTNEWPLFTRLLLLLFEAQWKRKTTKRIQACNSSLLHWLFHLKTILQFQNIFIKTSKVAFDIFNESNTRITFAFGWNKFAIIVAYPHAHTEREREPDNSNNKCIVHSSISLSIDYLWASIYCNFNLLLNHYYISRNKKYLHNLLWNHQMTMMLQSMIEIIACSFTWLANSWHAFTTNIFLYLLYAAKEKIDCIDNPTIINHNGKENDSNDTKEKKIPFKI